MNEREANQFPRRQFLLASALAGGTAFLPVPGVAQNSPVERCLACEAEGVATPGAWSARAVVSKETP